MSTTLRVVLALLLISVLAYIVSGKDIYSRLIYLWLFLVVASWVWSRVMLWGLQVTRLERSRRAQVGQVFIEQYEIRNTKRFPTLWLEVRDRSPIPGARGSRVFSIIRGGESRSYNSHTRLVQRGVFSIGPTELLSGDPFGLFRVRKMLPIGGALLVLPNMVDIKSFPNPMGMLPGGEALRHMTHQITLNAAGVREYAPGDSLNRIHWLSTARRDRLMVKEFELDPHADVWIFVDAARDVQAHIPYTLSSEAAEMVWKRRAKVQMPPSTEEYAVSVAASLARYYIQRERAVGLVSSGQSFDVLAPDRSGRQLGKIIEILALLRAEGDLPFPALVSTQARHLPRGSTVVLITPSVHREVAWCVDHLVRLELRPIVVLLDAGSFSGSKGTDALGASLRHMNIPVYTVENGANLEEVLSAEEPAAGFRRLERKIERKMANI